MLSQTSEHALRAVLYLARQPPGVPIAADAIAAALDAPANYLAKTLNALGKLGILASVRGPNGGFWLARPAEELSLAEVIRPFAAPRRSRICLMGARLCRDEDPCPVHFRWKAVNEEVWEPLHRTTVADLLQAETGEVDVAGTVAGTLLGAAGAAVRN